jgi:hypothetical protein
VGDATLKFGQSMNEELEYAQPISLLHGCRYSTGFTNLAVRVLPS